MDLGIFDLDGIIIDNLYRERGAIAAANSVFMPQVGIDPRQRYPETWNKVFYSLEALYNPAWFALDTLTESAQEMLPLLAEQLDHLLFLTSRPEYTRVPTIDSLEALQVFQMTRTDNSHLYMKPGPFTFTKTITWKAGEVQDILARYRPDRALFVDDSDGIRKEVQKENRSVLVAQDLREALVRLTA